MPRQVVTLTSHVVIGTCKLSQTSGGKALESADPAQPNENFVSPKKISDDLQRTKFHARTWIRTRAINVLKNCVM